MHQRDKTTVPADTHANGESAFFFNFCFIKKYDTRRNSNQYGKSIQLGNRLYSSDNLFEIAIIDIDQNL